MVKTNRLMNIKLLVLAGAILFYSCRPGNDKSGIDEGTLKGKTYSSEEIGWTIQIPDGWTLISGDKLKENDEKGRKAIAEIQGEVDISGLKHLVSFQKNPFNIFQSTTEPFELEYAGEWEENHEALKDLLKATYANQGMKADMSSSKAAIGGLEFHVVHIIIYAPDGEIILYQDMYSRYMNGLDFSVNLNYNNDRDKETLETVWKNSRFKKSGNP
jgi:hypothetical protein